MVKSSIEVQKIESKWRIPNYINTIFASVSGMLAIFVTQPADLLKTRMQLSTSLKTLGLTAVISSIIKENGYLGFYKGISAALLRQCTYTTGSLGVFYGLRDWYYHTYGELPNFHKMIMMGMCGGVVGSIIGNPAEVALIRMTADGRLPPEKRRNYTNVFNALSRMRKEEGLQSMWKGCSATIVRSAIVNGSQLSTYAQTRDVLKHVIDNDMWLRFVSGGVSAACTVVVSMPVDNIKTKVQNAKGKASPTNVFVTTIKYQGVLALWQGTIPMYFKMAPQNIIVFMLFEYMQNLYKKRVY